MNKELEHAKLIANSYDGDSITTEDIVTACMGMARWKDEQSFYVVTRCEEHDDYVEELFNDEQKAIDYCNCFIGN